MLPENDTVSIDDDPELAEAIRYVLPSFDLETRPLADDAMVFTCRRVWDDGEPVRYVSHDEDGSFQFICDGNEHTSEKEAVYLHVKHIFERGPEQLRDFAYLRKGHFARYAGDGKWNTGRIAAEES